MITDEFENLSANDYPIYTITAISEISGVHRDMILFYLKNGIVKPRKTVAHRNVLYSKNDLEILKFANYIKKSAKFFLTTLLIRELLKQKIDPVDFKEHVFEDLDKLDIDFCVQWSPGLKKEWLKENIKANEKIKEELLNQYFDHNYK